jgi:hypothetical protein
MPPAGMEERLHEIDPDLGVVWLPLVKRWAITLVWPRHDTRRELVRRGQLGDGAAFDIVAYLPEDCSADEAYGYIVRSFKAWAGSRDDVHKLLDRVHAYNKKQQREALRETEELADELIATNAPTLFRGEGKTATRFYMNGGKLSRSKPKVLHE